MPRGYKLCLLSQRTKFLIQNLDRVNSFFNEVSRPGRKVKTPAAECVFTQREIFSLSGKGSGEFTRENEAEGPSHGGFFTQS